MVENFVTGMLEQCVIGLIQRCLMVNMWLFFRVMTANIGSTMLSLNAVPSYLLAYFGSLLRSCLFFMLPKVFKDHLNTNTGGMKSDI